MTEGEKYMECTNPHLGQLIVRYDLGALGESEREPFAAHLLLCDACYEEVYSMAPIMAALRQRRAAIERGEIVGDRARVQAAIESTVSPFWLTRPAILVAASLLMAVGAVLFAIQLARQPSTQDIAQPAEPMAPAPDVAANLSSAGTALEIPKAVYAPARRPLVLRDDTSATAFEQAMMAYQQNNFAAAAEQLEVVSRLEPEHVEAHLYWGVSLLLAGQDREALAPLRQAVELSDGGLHESSRYYLALAYLKTNQPDHALAELDAVIQLAGQHQAAARQLKQRLVGSLK
jgi:tetratricopeptide (TPR) repeat protein